MSNYIDGPRSIGDAPADVTDLFAFTSSSRQSHQTMFTGRNERAPQLEGADMKPSVEFRFASEDELAIACAGWNLERAS
jgi:hypothetical protein